MSERYSERVFAKSVTSECWNGAITLSAKIEVGDECFIEKPGESKNLNPN